MFAVHRKLQSGEPLDLRQWQVQFAWRLASTNARPRGQSVDLYSVRHGHGHYGTIPEDSGLQISKIRRLNACSRKTAFDRSVQWESRHFHLHSVHPSRRIGHKSDGQPTPSFSTIWTLILTMTSRLRIVAIAWAKPGIIIWYFLLFKKKKISGRLWRRIKNRRRQIRWYDLNNN